VGVLIYVRGLRTGEFLLRFAPLRLLHAWLANRMFIDELYTALFVGVTMFLSWLAAAFDRVVVDGLVNGVAAAVRRAAFAAGATDKHVVDGAVNGLASGAQALGAAVRAPENGRIRTYITTMLVAVAVAAAGFVFAVLSAR
jgi:NADH:ubiquinone oxidoreductase subunit 5 (subunit L)/multisubunit Na+/H+ antiporter MnhA subunit